MAGRRIPPDVELRALRVHLARELGVRRSARDSSTLPLLQRVGWSERPLSPQIGAALQLVALARVDVDFTEARLIEQARKAGMSWADVADCLGLQSRQAAEQRYLRLQAAQRSASGQPTERDPQVTRQLNRTRKRAQDAVREAEATIRHLADLVVQDPQLDPQQWNVPGRAALSARLAALRRIRNHNTQPSSDLYLILVGLKHSLDEQAPELLEQLHPDLRAGLEQLAALYGTATAASR